MTTSIGWSLERHRESSSRWERKRPEGFFSDLEKNERQWREKKEYFSLDTKPVHAACPEVEMPTLLAEVNAASTDHAAATFALTSLNSKAINTNRLNPEALASHRLLPCIPLVQDFKPRALAASHLPAGPQHYGCLCDSIRVKCSHSRPPSSQPRPWSRARTTLCWQTPRIDVLLVASGAAPLAVLRC